MPEGVSNSLVNLGDLAKPADTLIKKVSKGIDGIFLPFQTVRLAKADAKAALIKAQSEVEVTDIQRRAIRRWLNEEEQKQQNIEDITRKSFQYLHDDTDAGNMDDDWVTNFFDKSKIVSDQEMQVIWARVLAGEANSPGTYSKRTVNSLADFDKRDAILFSKLCGFCFWGKIDSDSSEIFFPLIFKSNADIYSNAGINFSILQHLDSIGLIKFDINSRFFFKKQPPKLFVSYYGETLCLELLNDSYDNDLPIGQVLFTNTGQELSQIGSGTAVPAFMEYVKEQWKDYLPKPKKDDGVDQAINGTNSSTD
jgi:hypothetical protein